MTAGSHLSVRGREERVPIRVDGFLGHRPVSCLGRFGSPGPLFHFYLFSSFPFLVSLFKHNFCKNSSNNVKPISNIF
jgi:hypothetical protein